VSTTETNWLDVEGAAAHIGMSVAFVRKLVLEHRIRHYKVGRLLRFDPRDLDAFVEAGRVDAAIDARRGA